MFHLQNVRYLKRENWERGIVMQHPYQSSVTIKHRCRRLGFVKCTSTSQLKRLWVLYYSDSVLLTVYKMPWKSSCGHVLHAWSQFPKSKVMFVSQVKCVSKNGLLYCATNYFGENSNTSLFLAADSGAESLPDSINSLFKVIQASLLFRRLSSMALISKKGQLQSGNLAEHRHQQSLLRHKSSPSELHAT